MVRRTESRLPFKMKADELGEAAETLDKNAFGIYDLVSYLSSPLIKGTPNNYVVFVEIPVTTQVTPEKYIWKVDNSDTSETLESGETEIGCWQYTPPTDKADLKEIKVQVTVQLSGGNPEVIQLSLKQKVENPWNVIDQLTTGATAMSERFASTFCFHPGAARELLENFSGYIELAALREKMKLPSQTPDPDPGASWKPEGKAVPASLLAAVVYRDMLLRPGAFGAGTPLAFLKPRAEEDERLTRHMNSDDWSERLKSLHGRKIGVCGISLLTAALSLGLVIKGDEDYSKYIKGITDEKEQNDNRKLFVSRFHQYIAADATAGLDLFNLLRFPKSNILLCLHILNGWKNKIEISELKNMELIKEYSAMALLADAYHYFPFFSNYTPNSHKAQPYGVSVLDLVKSPLVQSFFTSSHEAHSIPFRPAGKEVEEVKKGDMDALGRLIKNSDEEPTQYNITAVQSDLYRLDLLASEYINGYYGQETEDAVADLQLLGIEAGDLQTGYKEGIVDAKTSKALRNQIVQKDSQKS